MYSYAADTPLPIVGIGAIIVGLPNMHSNDNKTNKSDISYLKTSLAFDVPIHSGKPYSVG